MPASTPGLLTVAFLPSIELDVAAELAGGHDQCLVAAGGVPICGAGKPKHRRPAAFHFVICLGDLDENWSGVVSRVGGVTWSRERRAL